ncbi:MAG: hypothetical protein IJA89_04275 [Clostridia bacterium]|nr:hypothetical protein [Clostridia bacterium]
MKYYIGIDGGGTKTEFVLTDERGNVLSRVLKTGSNPNDIGMENSYIVLSNGLKELLQGAMLNLNDLFIFAGIAGTGVGETAKILQEKLSVEYPHVQVASDLMNALEVCLQGEDGLAVICGTGLSCCICENSETRIVGGYGYLFEDGGSGYAYGRDAVNAALKYEDGIGEKTVLLKYLQTYFSKTVRASLGELLTKGKFFVASFCPIVFQGYAAGDAVCKKIVENNLQSTVWLVKNALALSKQKKKKLSFIGGVSKEPLFQERMRKEFDDCEVLFCAEKPVWGAVRLAIQRGEKWLYNV